MSRLIIFLVSWISAFLIFSFGDNHFTPQSCKAVVSFIKGNERLDMVVFQSLFSGVGTLSISGELYDMNKSTGYISKTIKFSYEKEGYDFFATSEAILKSPHMTLSKEQEIKWFPAFFYEQGKSLVWKIRPITNNASLVLSETVPLFLCKKTR